MKTRPIPVIVMLLAGFLSCIYGIINHLDIMTFIWTLLLVMIIFYILGSVIKVIIDKNFKNMRDRNPIEQKEEQTKEKTDEKSDGDTE